MENNTKYKHRDYSAEWLHLLVESALDAVITMDSGGRIIAFNLLQKIFLVILVRR